MIKNDDSEEIMPQGDFLIDVLPKYIVNAKGENEEFDIERIHKSLVVDVGLEEQQADVYNGSRSTKNSWPFKV